MKRSLLVVSAALLLAAAPTPEQQAKYRAAMKRGKQKTAAHDLDGAIAAWKEAAAALDGDARALSELGLAALQKRDFKLAEEATRKSIAGSAQPDVKGASLYNLGRIFEEQGDKTAAVDAYRKSLEARPNATVRERLIALDPAAAAAADPAAPHAMLGPFSSIKQFCADYKKTACDGGAPDKDDERDPYACGREGAALAHPKAPWLAAELLSTSCDSHGDGEAGHVTLHLAVRVAAGWFVAGESGERVEYNRTQERFEAVALELTELVTGAPPQIVLSYSNVGTHDGGCADSEWSRSYWVFAGVGPSGKPTASGRLLTARDETSTPNSECEDEKPYQNHERLKVSLDGGVLEIATADGKPLKGAARGLYVGKHAFVFP
jgi:tetratricopeptide (TPR) repeat protein